MNRQGERVKSLIPNGIDAGTKDAFTTRAPAAYTRPDACTVVFTKRCG